MKAQFDAEIEAEGTIPPSGVEVRWTENQISVVYDNEVSIIPLTDDEFIKDESEWSRAPRTPITILRQAVGMYEMFRDHQDEME